MVRFDQSFTARQSICSSDAVQTGAIGAAAASSASVSTNRADRCAPQHRAGVDLIYIDPEIEPEASRRTELLKSLNLKKWSGAPIDMFTSVNPVYTKLRRSLMKYRGRWGDLPQVQIPAGSAAIKAGVRDGRVPLLRHRLGLPGGTVLDNELTKAVSKYQTAHGLKSDGVAGNRTVHSIVESMGEMKFMLPNDFGIYLHNVPEPTKVAFAKDDRAISNGCVRLEDAKRLQKWVLGGAGACRDWRARSARGSAKANPSLHDLFYGCSCCGRHCVPARPL